MGYVFENGDVGNMALGPQTVQTNASLVTTSSWLPSISGDISANVILLWWQFWQISNAILNKRKSTNRYPAVFKNFPEKRNRISSYPVVFKSFPRKLRRITINSQISGDILSLCLTRMGKG